MFKPMLSTGDDPRTYKIIGAAMEVHRVLGAGYLEVFYKDALKIEFSSRAIPFDADVPCNAEYKGHPLRGTYKMDFVCFGEVVLEVKARSNTGPADHAQVISYLANSKLRIGLLLNFGGDRLDYRRFIWTPKVTDVEVAEDHQGRR
jgi:GxxExxY protein